MCNKDEGRRKRSKILVSAIVAGILALIAGVVIVHTYATPTCAVVRVGQSQIVQGHLVEVRQQDELGQQIGITVSVGPGDALIWTGQLVVRRWNDTFDKETNAAFAGQLLTPTTLTIPTRPYAGINGNIVGISLCDK